MIRTALVASLALTATAHAQAENQVYVETTDLGSGIYMLATNQAGNVGVSVGEDGVFMIDTQMEQFAAAIDQAQREVSGDRAVDLVLNTHLHGDHVRGNAYFAEQGATIMAHPSVRDALMNPVTAQLTGSTPEPLSGGYLPTVGVNDGDVVTLNGVTARLHFTPAAHTNGDLFVEFEDANVIHAGDLLFSGWFPYIDLDNGGTVDGYIAGMQAIVDVADADTQIIPGHGPLSTEADLEASIAMLTEAKARVQALVDQGMNLQQVQDASPLADFHDEWNWGFITTERMVWTLYRDITGEIE
jgi:glyoxylase-like metal-dependent hydrolase (beta-lactamase superfamily II)